MRQPVAVVPGAENFAEEELVAITAQLAKERLYQGLAQREIAVSCAVSDNTISVWESGQESVKVPHLIRWARALGLRLLIADADGVALRFRVPREHEETWLAWELRKIAETLRAVRLGNPALTQREVANRAGVSRASIKNWENLKPPEALGLLRWASALQCRVLLAPW